MRQGTDGTGPLANNRRIMRSALLPPPQPLRRQALHRLSLLGLAALLGGCASLGRDPALRPGLADAEAQLRSRYGAPRRSWAEADGGRMLEYSSQPMGQTCYMVRLDAVGRLRSITDTLSPAERERVQPGMSPAEVSRLLGLERSRVFFRRSGEEVWDWTVAPEAGGLRQRFNVHFKQGRVLRTSLSPVYPDERRFPPGD